MNHPEDDESIQPMSEAEFAAALPWAKPAQAALETARDLDHGAELLRALGLDDATARQLAAHHFGTHSGSDVRPG